MWVGPGGRVAQDLQDSIGMRGQQFAPVIVQTRLIPDKAVPIKIELYEYVQKQRMKMNMR